ncbi:hypothetical protein MMI99_05150, partial [Enterococcus cecorum]|nr:hypothetical protein [Enterococcus cecorum]
IIDGIKTDFSFMILKWKIAFSYLAFSTWEVISWEEITKDKHCYITVKKIIPHRKGLCTKNRVEFYRKDSKKKYSLLIKVLI